MPFDQIRRKLKPLPSLEEVEALSSPSIMDEYIEKNDPEQFATIEEARNIQMALDSVSGMGGAMGNVKSIAPALSMEALQALEKAKKMENWTKMMREVDPNYDPSKSVSFLDHNSPDYESQYKRITDLLKK